MTAGRVPDLRLPAVELARALLGCRLECLDDEGRVRGGVVVETEAYPGGEDEASHSRGGLRTARNRSMYLAGGHVYVYLVYGLHHCLNIVSGEADSGEAVLVRAIRPSIGLEAMRDARPGRVDRDLARGPGRLCQAMGIGLDLDGTRVGDRLRLLGRPPEEADASPIVSTTRVGVAYAGDWAARPWRFLLGDRAWWSRPPTGPGSRSPAC